ncbi:MAG: hypothetical protein RIE56_09835 [Amphiplicatus sp.]
MTVKPADNSERVVVPCPQCPQKLSVPPDRGALKVTCPACKQSFEWRPDADEPIEAVVMAKTERAAPVEATAPPRRRRLSGLLLLLACCAFLMWMMAVDPLDGELPTWLELPIIPLGFAFLFLFYRGFRMLTGAGVFVSILAAMFLPNLPIFAGEMLRPYAQERWPEVVASLSGGGSAEGEARPGAYFKGLSARNTSAADLDGLMEDW